MRLRILKYRRNQTCWLPCSSPELWFPVEQSFLLLNRFDLALEVIEPCGQLSPVRCLILAQVGRESGLGVTAGRLARTLKVPRATLSHHLKALRRARLLQWSGRRAHDQRKRWHVLTPLGAKVLLECSELLKQAVDSAPAGSPRRHHWHLRRLPPASAGEHGIRAISGRRSRA